MKKQNQSSADSKKLKIKNKMGAGQGLKRPLKISRSSFSPVKKTQVLPDKKTKPGFVVKAVIGCRPSPEFRQNFFEWVNLLGVTDSELARRALEAGFNAAVNEIASEQTQKNKEIQKRLNRRKS